MSLYKPVNDVFDIPGQMAHNVLAVCDGFAVAIKERGAFQQPQNCGGAKHHKGRKPDWCFAEPEPPNGRRSAYSLVMRSAIFNPLYATLCAKSGGKNRRFTGAGKRWQSLPRPPLGV